MDQIYIKDICRDVGRTRENVADEYISLRSIAFKWKDYYKITIRLYNHKLSYYLYNDACYM